MGVPNPFRMRPLLGAKIPLNATYSPLITMYNPFETTLQVCSLSLILVTSISWLMQCIYLFTGFSLVKVLVVSLPLSLCLSLSLPSVSMCVCLARVGYGVCTEDTSELQH